MNAPAETAVEHELTIVKRHGSCVVDIWDLVPVVARHVACGCDHHQWWPEAADYGFMNGTACQPCAEGTCEHSKGPLP